MKKYERCVDELGRVVLPQEFRKELGITERSHVLIGEENGVITIEAAKSLCKLCGSDKDICADLPICTQCVAKIKRM